MELLDNVGRLFGDDLKKSLKPNSRLKFAASCFSIYAYEALKSELENIECLQFIFTSPTFTPSEATDKIRKELREFHIPKLNRERSVYGTEFEIHLRNKLTQRAIARECSDWIRRKAQFRSNSTKSPMQSFAAYTNSENSAVYMQISGFTTVDLGYETGNAVSNYIAKNSDPGFTQNFISLFDQIWNDPNKIQDVTDTVCEHIESIYRENSPEKIYFLILYNIFHEFLEDINEDVLPNDLTGYKDSVIWRKLFNFQRDAANGIINKLETYNGCILADSVGLGKTFTALAVIKYYELRNKSVLVLCPKKLADNWLNYNKNLTTNVLAADRLNYDVLCHTDLSRTSGESLGIPLNRVNWGNYDLVVIDESHNFRNNDVFKERDTRYQRLMNMVIRQGVKTKVLMLSATPVNNRFNDLRNQLALAYEGQSEFLSKHLKTTTSVEEIFRRAQRAFNVWTTLEPEKRTANALLRLLDFDFFELLDAVTIARSRKHIETFYDTADIGKFPRRLKPLSFHCPITNRPDVMGLNDIFFKLSAIKMAVYAPLSYVLPSRLAKYESLYDTLVEGGKSTFRQRDREKNIQSLMTTNLLKRLESSVDAFRLTLNALNSGISNTLDTIVKFEKGGSVDKVDDLIIDNNQFDPEDDELPSSDEYTIGGKIQIDLRDMNLPVWKEELQEDQRIICELLDSMNKITPEHDAKLQHFLNQVREKINNPINPGNKKVLVFTAFADTANYLYDNLVEALKGSGLHAGKVTGSSSPKSTLKKSYDFQSILTLFSPRSKERDQILPDEKEEIDILIGTDCISEGQNLQDCDFLINYDIHWNPVRIIQRFGRIDRIGSCNEQIQLANYWPDITLDEYINLKERVENKMMIMDIAAGGDDNVLTAKANDIAYRKEQIKRLQNEVIELEDAKTGVSITDLGLNDFRMDLINYKKNNDNIENLPLGMHAVVPAQPEIGMVPGTIFVLKNIHDSVNINLQNRLHPYYLIYIDNDGKVIHPHTEPKRLLDLLRSGCKGHSEPYMDLCREFNRRTKDGRNMEQNSKLLSKAIRTMIDIKEEKDIDSLFSPGATTALSNTMNGLDDFELIGFMVIVEKTA